MRAGDEPEQGRVTTPLDRPVGQPVILPAIYAIHAANKSVEKQWRDLAISHGGKLRHFYDYLSQTPRQRDGERVFPLKGPQTAGVWECEVGGGARLLYTVDDQKKVVLIKVVKTSHA